MVGLQVASNGGLFRSNEKGGRVTSVQLKPNFPHYTVSCKNVFITGYLKNCA
jgi:hypothetical protein